MLLDSSISLSLSLTISIEISLPIFIAIVASTAAVSGIVAATGQFLMYALGMGSVILALTLGAAMFKENKMGFLRKVAPIFQPLSAILMISAGSYVVFYWLTIGGLVL